MVCRRSPPRPLSSASHAAVATWGTAAVSTRLRSQTQQSDGDRVAQRLRAGAEAAGAQRGPDVRAEPCPLAGFHAASHPSPECSVFLWDVWRQFTCLPQSSPLVCFVGRGA